MPSYGQPSGDDSDAWSIQQDTDALTDETVTRVISTNVAGVREQMAVVRATGRRLDLYVDFGEYLSDDFVPIRYRVDKAAVANESWSPSAEGTSVFAAEPAELTRLLMQASVIVLEAQDYRGQPHRATFSLAGAGPLFQLVLDQCGISHVGMEKEIPGLRRDIAIELESWGPMTIASSRRILAHIGWYNGPSESRLDPDFAIAVQRLYDEYVRKCKAGRIRGVNCDSLQIFWNAGIEPIMPPVSAVIYELAPAALQKEAGRLKMGD